jgi:predicted dehydrogenase
MLETNSLTPKLTRRQFVTGASATALTLSIVKPSVVRAAEANSKLTWGLIGCGGRGGWLANLFEKHGGYRLTAVADYFQDRVDQVGEKFKVPASQRFIGLSGYRRLLEQNLDAVVIQTPPYFHPEQAAAAVTAGRHVFLAKPIAVDVPGCISIEESGRKATEQKLSFLVDFQTRAHPDYQQAVQRVHSGKLGRVVSVESSYQTSTMFASLDAKLRAEPHHADLRLRAWALDRGLSGDIITEQNIHTLDVVTWFLNAAPVRAYGSGGRAREFVGNCWDHFAIIFYFPNDVLVSFSSKQVGFGYDDIMCRVYGMEGTADTHYSGKVTVKTKEDPFNGDTPNLYLDGAVRNIATFYENITQGNCANPTVSPSVRSNLTTILGRTAAYQGREVTWSEMMRACEKLEANLSGLRA